jgi:hypothetical protein
MLYNSENQPILKDLIDAELSPEQQKVLEEQPMYIQEQKESLSKIFVGFLEKLIEHHHFDTSIKLKL